MTDVAELAAEWSAKRAAARAAAAPDTSRAGRRRRRWGGEDDPGQVLGSTTPRVWTRPLVSGEPGPCGCGCALTRDTSYGFLVDDFATRIGLDLDPWQRWLVIHAGELLPDGRPRFRWVLVLVARQNGKTHLLVVLTLFWQWVQRVPLVLGTSTKLDYARESWLKAVKFARKSWDLAPAIADRDSIRKANGEQELIARFPVLDEAGEPVLLPDGSQLFDECRYKIGAANPEGGRSLTLHRLVEDEFRQHYDYSADAAAGDAMNAVEDAQGWRISNEGDDRSIPLHEIYDACVKFIDTGEGDPRSGVFAWSAPEGSDPEDVQALAAANPNLNRVRRDGSTAVAVENVLGKARTVKGIGGEALARFKIETMCMRVPSLLPSPVDVPRWRRLVSDEKPEGRPAFFVAVSGGLRRSVIAVAAMRGGMPHVELADDLDGTAGVVGRLVQLAERYPNAKFGMSAASPARKSLEPEFARAGLRVDWHTTPDIASGCAHLQSLINDDGLTHSDDEAVDASLEAAVPRSLEGGAWIWDWERSAGLAPAAAVAGALWVLEVHRDSDYDLDQSIW
jgi:hypothetical protein